MRRIGIVAAALAALAGAARAEAPLDWYTELKREAKYARIAALASNWEALRSHQGKAETLLARISTWSPAPARASAVASCQQAALRLKALVEAVRPSPDLARTLYDAQDEAGDRCVHDIWGR